MALPQSRGAGDTGPQIRLFDESVESVQRIGTPLYNWAEIAAGEQQRIEIPEDERQDFAESTSLRQFYEHDRYGLARVNDRRVDEGTLAGSTLRKISQSLNRWEAYSPQPADWPADRPWLGRPLAWITDQHVTDWARAASARLATSTISSTWGTLRAIFAHAVAVRAIGRVPEPARNRSEGHDREPKAIYSDEQLAAVHAAVDVDLQAAFVVAVNAGLRPVDLFCLRWESLHLSIERPFLEFQARKTGKAQILPLHDVTVRHLRRWQRASGVIVSAGESCGAVWPKLSDSAADEPESSRAARRRNKRFKRSLAGCGIHFGKPWQVARATCNERLESHRPGSGQFVLGHSLSLNSRSYREPSGYVYEAVSTLSQPDCFWI